MWEQEGLFGGCGSLSKGSETWTVLRSVWGGSWQHPSLTPKVWGYPGWPLMPALPLTLPFSVSAVTLPPSRDTILALTNSSLSSGTKTSFLRSKGLVWASSRSFSDLRRKGAAAPNADISASPMAAPAVGRKRSWLPFHSPPLSSSHLPGFSFSVGTLEPSTMLRS